jgi:hemerythrin-like metal-binding protein
VTIQWDAPSMALGVRAIDAEHKHLIDFLSLASKTSADKRKNIIDRKLLFTIRELFQKHFLHEEDLMFGIKYKRVDSHMIEHSTMLTTLDILIRDFDENTGPVPTVEFITSWIITHMKTYDADLAVFIKKLRQIKAAKAAPPGQTIIRSSESSRQTS